MEILKVSSKSNPSKVAGAIANIYRENKEVEIQTIGEIGRASCRERV